MAIGMLTPFLLNYFVCFITFLRKETNKKITFIFALLNIYPQFGKYKQSFREITSRSYSYDKVEIERERGVGEVEGEKGGWKS